jgi:hypothetical protein
MRVCVFLTDLGGIAVRKDALLGRITELAGDGTATDVSFVGCRQSSAIEPSITAYQPYVDKDSYTRMQVANALFRIADVKLAPIQAARAGLSLCAPQLVETILACDPDLVLLDVRWGRYLKVELDADLPGRVFVSGDRRTLGAAVVPAKSADFSTKVSIILPTHNGLKYIRQSIQSCLDQSHRNIELIVVDDGSTEDVGPVLSEFTDARIRLVRHERNRGLSAALNTGFALASGDYLTWTSDDNHYDEHAIERLTRFLQNHPGIDFVYASSYIVNDLQKPAALRIRTAQPPQDLRRQNGVGACFLYTRRVYQEIGDYDSETFLVEDYDYWVRVSKRFRMQRIFSPLYYYRYHKGSLTSKYGSEGVAARFNVVKQQSGIA